MATFRTSAATGDSALGTPLNNYGSISQRTAAYAAKQMLEHAEPILVLSKFAQSKPLPKNTSDTIAFRRPKPFGVQYVKDADGNPTSVVASITEGVTPAEQQMQYEDVWVKLNQYGGLTKITDVVQDLAEDPVLSDASMLSGEQAAETIEMLTWGVLRGGTNVLRAGPLNAKVEFRSQVEGKISVKQIRSVTRSLKAARAKPITQIMSSSVNYGTQSVEGGYVAFCHTDCENDIRELPGFTHLADYGSRKPLCPEEIGTFENVRFIMSPLLTPFMGAGARNKEDTIVSSGDFEAQVENTTTLEPALAAGPGVDVYPVVIIAKHAYGLVPLKGAKAITPTVLNPGVPSKSDPLGQIGFVGWKAYFAATILNETWMSRFEVGVSEL